MSLIVNVNNSQGLFSIQQCISSSEYKFLLDSGQNAKQLGAMVMCTDVTQTARCNGDVYGRYANSKVQWWYIRTLRKQLGAMVTDVTQTASVQWLCARTLRKQLGAMVMCTDITLVKFCVLCCHINSLRQTHLQVTFRTAFSWHEVFVF